MLTRTHVGCSVGFADNGTLSTLLGKPVGEDDGIFDMQGVAYGAIFIPAAWTTADLCFMVSHKRDGTYTMLRAVDGTVVKIDIDNKTMWYAIPPEVFMCNFVKLQSSDQTTPTTPVTQTGGPLTLFVSMGS